MTKRLAICLLIAGAVGFTLAPATGMMLELNSLAPIAIPSLLMALTGGAILGFHFIRNGTV